MPSSNTKVADLLTIATRAHALVKRNKQKRTAALRELRLHCPHEQVVAYHDRGKMGIRVCIMCGLEDHGRWGRYDILTTEFCKTSKTIDGVRGACDLPTQIWRLCRGTDTEPAHAVSQKEMAGETGYCKAHVGGQVCPACGGKGRWWYSYSDGYGGGRWTNCETCDKTGVITTDEQRQRARKYNARRCY